MIALLRGVLLEKHPNQAIVEAGGVGYDVTIPVSTFTHLPDAGAEVRLRIHTHVREDALALYGFLTQDEKALFEKLISRERHRAHAGGEDSLRAGGAGPDPCRSAAARWTGWCKIPGHRQEDRRAHGAGTARQAAGRRPARSRGTPARAEALSPIDQDVLSALLNLGCARPQAEAAVRKAKAGAALRAEFEPLFRRALELVR